DGIRDPLVTGVQTCALPISAAEGGANVEGRDGRRGRRHGGGGQVARRSRGRANERRSSCRESVGSPRSPPEGHGPCPRMVSSAWRASWRASYWPQRLAPVRGTLRHAGPPATTTSAP